MIRVIQSPDKVRTHIVMETPEEIAAVYAALDRGVSKDDSGACARICDELMLLGFSQVSGVISDVIAEHVAERAAALHSALGGSTADDQEPSEDALPIVTEEEIEVAPVAKKKGRK